LAIAAAVAADTPVLGQSIISSCPIRCASVIRAKSCCAGDWLGDEVCVVDRAGGTDEDAGGVTALDESRVFGVLCAVVVGAGGGVLPGVPEDVQPAITRTAITGTARAKRRMVSSPSRRSW
jgi:hypothetical protein